MTSVLSKALTYLAVAAVLIAGTTTGHHGHADKGEPLSSLDGGMVLSAAAHDHTGGQEEPDRTDGDFAQSSSCAMNHCCYPVPSLQIVRVAGGLPYWSSDFPAWQRLSERLDPPPPKLA